MVNEYTKQMDEHVELSEHRVCICQSVKHICRLFIFYRGAVFYILPKEKRDEFYISPL